MGELAAALADERRYLADLLESLTPEQWQVRTLCSAWTVHDMAAHLVMPIEGTVLDLMRATVRARGNADRIGVLMTARFAELPSAELVTRLRANAESSAGPPMVGEHGPYSDSLIHGEDIRIPLGIADDRPQERWRPTLDFLMTRKARLGFLPAAKPDLWYQATDVEWQHGRGDVVSGPAATLALALCGRAARLDELDGPGSEVLSVHATG